MKEQMRFNWIALLPLAIVAGAVVMFAVSLILGQQVRYSGRLGAPAPALVLPPVGEIDTQAPRLHTPGGQWTVVNFWASWCGPCEIEHPLLVALGERPDLVLVGVAYKDTPRAADAFLTRLGNPFDQLGDDASGRTAIEWGVSGVPETFLVSPEGEIVAHVPGPLTPDLIAAWPLPKISAANK